MKLVLGLFLILMLFLIIIPVFSLDHFKTINSLDIKYNSSDIIVPNQLKKPSPKILSIKDKINSKLKNQPLAFNDVLFSSNKYPYVGKKQFCLNDETCNINSVCNYDTIFNRDFGVGVCTLRYPDETVFNIKY